MPRLVPILVLVAALAPAPCGAWSLEAHRLIMDRAIDLLPGELQPLYRSRRAFIVERAADPDFWRTAGWADEPPNHYLDLDWGGYGPYPFEALPRQQDEAVQRFGRETIDRYGRLPWRTAEFYGQLQRAFESIGQAPYVLENIAYFSAVLSHYVSDAHVPFHAVLNYDGQLTHQDGLHARFETELFDREAPRITLAPAAPVAVTLPRDAIFDALLASYRLAGPVLEADHRAAAGREYYDDGYFAVFREAAAPVLEQRLNDSVTAVAAFIIGAWEQAGRPAVPASTPRTPRRVPRQP